MVAPTMIKEHMEVLGADGVHVGTVDQLEGRDQVKLTKDDPDAGGEHHFIPLAWGDRVDSTVHLKKSGREAKARWETHWGPSGILNRSAPGAVPARGAGDCRLLGCGSERLVYQRWS